jgi:hypothetical protein
VVNLEEVVFGLGAGVVVGGTEDVGEDGEEEGWVHSALCRLVSQLIMAI